MTSHHHNINIEEERYHLEGMGLNLVTWGGIAGIAALVTGLLISLLLGEGLRRFFFSYLTSFSYFLSIALGGLFFVLIHHATRAGWSVVVRRIAEFTAANSLLLAILFLPILFGMESLYHWVDKETVAQDALLQTKEPYLNVPFFLIRMVIYFGTWCILSYFMLSRSLQQDTNGDPQLTLSMEKISYVGLLLFAITISYGAIDLMMTLDPHWFSTILGVYYFAGSTLSFFAFLSLAVYFLQKNGRLTNAITLEHYHDLGKYTFAFIFFWGYIAFSQYMLIWYANIPEETNWLLRRESGPWVWLGLTLIFGHFAIPFMGLISRSPKRKKAVLAFWAVWILVMHYVDLFWLIMPEYYHFAEGEIPEVFCPFSWVDLFTFIGIGGLFLAGFARAARGKALVPLKDPRLEESLAFENF